jgi:AraC-like DNA-binding protein
MDHSIGWDQLNPVVSYANRLCCEPGYSFGPRIIREYQFIYVAEGIGEAFIGSKSYSASAGDLFFYGPGVVHQFTAGQNQPFVLYGIHFIPIGQIPTAGAVPFRPPIDVKATPSVAIQGELWIGDTVDRLCVPEHMKVDDSFVEAIFTRITAVFQTPDAQHHLENRGLLIQFFLNLHKRIRQSRAAGHSPDQADLIERMKRLLSSRSDQPYNRRWLSEWSRYHENHAAALFVLHAGISPHDYFLNCKLDRAKRMLAEEGLSVEETANLLHFGSIHHFSRLFKRRIGCPPSIYRRLGRLI